MAPLVAKESAVVLKNPKISQQLAQSASNDAAADQFCDTKSDLEGGRNILPALQWIRRKLGHGEAETRLVGLSAILAASRRPNLAEWRPRASEWRRHSP